MSTVFALNAATSGTYANRNIMVGTCARIVPKGEEMKKRKKLNFWTLLPETAPYILALMFWRYSNLNAEQTIMIIIGWVIFYALCIASAESRISTEKRKD